MVTLQKGTSVSWDDVYRFTGNNFIGRKIYQPYINNNKDAGVCLSELARLVDNYIPANIYAACFKYGITEAQYRSVVQLAAESITKRRNKKDEPLEYWKFCLDNCMRLFDAMMEGELD